MGTDQRSPAEIEREARTQSVEAFAANLLFLPTAQQIRESVRSMRGIEGDELAAALTSVERAYSDHGRKHSAALVSHVRKLLGPVLPHPSTAELAITDRDSLIDAVFQASNGLSARRLLLRHRELVDKDLSTHLLIRQAAHRDRPIPHNEALGAYLIARILGDKRDMVKGLLMWGSVCRQRQWIRNAKRHLERAKSLAVDLDDSTFRIMIIGAQAGLFRALEQYAEAIAVLEEGLKLSVKAGSKRIAESFAQGLATCYRITGQHAKALDSVNHWISLLDKESAAPWDAFNLRGLVHEDLGLYEDGMIDYEAAIEHAVARQDRSGQFVSMTNRASSFLKRGLPEQAYKAFLRILREAEKWGNLLMAASTHNNLGQALLSMDNYAAASREFAQALTSKVNSSDSNGEATAFMGLAQCSEATGDYAGANDLLTLALIPALTSGDAQLVASVTLAQSTEKLLLLDKIEGIVESLRWARDLARQQSYPLHELLLTVRLAECLVKMGRLNEALAECEEQIKTVSYDSQLHGVQELEVKYASLLASAGDGRWREAVDILLKRVHVIEERIASALLDVRRAEIVSGARPVYGALLQLLGSPEARPIHQQKPAEFAFNLHESAKSRTFLSLLSSAKTVPPAAGIPDALLEKESALLEQQRLLRSDRSGSQVNRMERTKQIRAELLEVWRTMQPYAPAYVRSRSGSPYRFAEIRDTLAAATSPPVLLSFFAGDDVTTCFLVAPGDKQPRMFLVPIGAAELKQIARQLRRAFNGAPEEFPPYPPIRGDAPFKRKLPFLDALSSAFGEVLGALPPLGLICIAPHGPLHLLPFHALRRPNGTLLAEGSAVVYLPSVSAGAASFSRVASSVNPHSPMRLFVAGVSAAEDTNPQYFESDDELFDDGRWQKRSCIGPAHATKSAVLAHVSASDVVHLSCHAFFEENNPLHSGLIFGDGVHKAPRDIRELSFLDRQRFVVTAGELMDVTLDAELVSLSACSTGLQRERNGGDELDGFARALLAAGARSALLALWNVDQETSQAFLKSFYRHWLNSGRKWQALHNAQLDFIQSGDSRLAHPYHWAAFTLVGDWN